MSRRTAVIASGDWTAEVELPVITSTTTYFPVAEDESTVTLGQPVRIELVLDQDEHGGWVVLQISATAHLGPEVSLPGSTTKVSEHGTILDWASGDPVTQAALDRIMKGSHRPLNERDARLVAQSLTHEGVATQVLAYAEQLRRRDANQGVRPQSGADRLKERARAGSRAGARTHEDFVRIAELARGATVTGQAPAVAVQLGLPCSRARAYQLLNQAVELGYLTKDETVTKGRASGKEAGNA